jgi:hypothetical protein
MKILKGVKNIFDFKCVEVLEKDSKKVQIESYENSQILEDNLKIGYYFRGIARTRAEY